jgi:hypothetical protein
MSMTKITLITRMTQPTNIKQNLASSKHCNMALYWLVRVKKFLVWARVQVSQLSSVRRTWHSESERNAIKKNPDISEDHIASIFGDGK